MDQDRFRELLGHFATGVAVLTTRQPDGEPSGMTVNSIASVSLSPPLLLVCVDRRLDVHEHLRHSRSFALNILSARQDELSRRFAGPSPERFGGVGYRLNGNGVAILDDVVAFIECERTGEADGGDHTVFFGRVTGGAVAAGRPLLFYRGQYGSMGDGS